MGDNIKIIVCKSKKDIKDFLDFPKILYTNEYNPQDYKVEKQLLEGKHVLSNNFKITPIIAYQTNCDKHEVVARCIITEYENDNKAYIGLFESIDNSYVYLKFLKEIEDRCKKLGKSEMVGPVDASFWIRYRFKVESDREFTDTYTGEPYNKQIYTRMWKEAGFTEEDIYYSNIYRKVNESDFSEKGRLRLRQMVDKGYKIEKSSFRNFNKDIVVIYRLITELYSKFPIYKHITLEQFKKLFGGLRFILNYSMVYLVSKDNKKVAFFICVPNYRELNKEHSTIKKIFKLLKLRNKPKEYIMLYMGVEPKHLGLGYALAEVTKQELAKNGCTSVGALIHEGKATGIYYNKLIVGKTKYITLNKKIA